MYAAPLLLVALCALVLAPNALAAPSRVQLASDVRIVYKGCPYYAPVGGLFYSCYAPASRTIYLARQDRHSRDTWFHEFGHADDDQRLTPDDRAKIETRMGWGRWKPEQYADRYSECARDVSNSLCSLLPRSAYGVWRDVA